MVVRLWLACALFFRWRQWLVWHAVRLGRRRRCGSGGDAECAAAGCVSAGLGQGWLKGGECCPRLAGCRVSASPAGRGPLMCPPTHTPTGVARGARKARRANPGQGFARRCCGRRLGPGRALPLLTFAVKCCVTKTPPFGGGAGANNPLYGPCAGFDAARRRQERSQPFD